MVMVVKLFLQQYHVEHCVIVVIGDSFSERSPLLPWFTMQGELIDISSLHLLSCHFV
jgi:hypothetical protein